MARTLYELAVAPVDIQGANRAVPLDGPSHIATKREQEHMTAEAVTGKTMRADLVQATVQPAGSDGPVSGLLARVAELLYDLDPVIDSGETVDGFQVSPAGPVSWQQLIEMGDASTIDHFETMAQAAIYEVAWACSKVAENPGFIEARDTDWDQGVNYAKRFIASAIRQQVDDRTNDRPDLQRQNETDSLRLERDALLAALTEANDRLRISSHPHCMEASIILEAALTASKATGERT
jgi:hypothetical protein